MKLLALEMATSAGSVALLEGTQVLQREFDPRGDGVVAAMGRILAEAGCRPVDVGAVAVSVGPGSFTGTRIAVSAAQGFCRGTGAQAVAVGTLDGLAWSARESDWGMEGAWVLPSVDARRGEVYAALYRVAGDRPELHWGPEAISCGELAVRILGNSEDTRVEQGVLVGDGAPLLAPLFPEGAGWAAPAPVARCQAGAVARAGARILESGGGVPPEQLVPVYLRKSDAEVRREQRLSSG